MIKTELHDIKKKFSTPRRSDIIDKEYEQIDDINYIQKEDIIITISNNGYIKRSLSSKTIAHKIGVAKVKQACLLEKRILLKKFILTDTHTKLLVFSTFGKVYALKAFDIPEASLKAKG